MEIAKNTWRGSTRIAPAIIANLDRKWSTPLGPGSFVKNMREVFQGPMTVEIFPLDRHLIIEDSQEYQSGGGRPASEGRFGQRYS